MIKIVTVYNSLNPGSFFQATSLYSVIQERYGNVDFYNTKSRNTYLSGMKLFVKLLAKGRIGSAFAQLKMAHQYVCRVKQFRQTREAGENDIYILGADEIWNVSRKKMAKYPVFWGEGLDQKRCIAYAPSLNNAGQADLEKYAYVHEALDKLWAISVRDLNSKEILSTFTDRFRWYVTRCFCGQWKITGNTRSRKGIIVIFWYMDRKHISAKRIEREWLPMQRKTIANCWHTISIIIGLMRSATVIRIASWS